MERAITAHPPLRSAASHRTAMRLLKITALALASALLLHSASAQKAEFKTYAPKCGRWVKDLAIQGLPQLGTTFTVTGMRFPYGCTYSFCGCTPGRCNSCTGSLLVVGVRKVNVPLGPTGCALRVSPDVILAGSGRLGAVSIAVPNNPVLNGFQFHMQRADVSMWEVVTATCKRVYPLRGVGSWSNAVTGTIGK